MEIIYEDNHLLVVEKPENMPVCLDESNDEDLLSYLKKYLKEKYQKPGNVYLGLVHRLDRPVAGVMVFAKTSKAASRLAQQLKTNKFHKCYLAAVHNHPTQHEHLEDYLLKDEKTNTTKVDPKGKLAILDYYLLEKKNDLSLLKVDIQTGRSHQIRVQLAHNGTPIYGDQRYNKIAKPNQQIALYAYYLSFYHPITNQKLVFTHLPKSKQFSIFEMKGVINETI